MSRLSLDMTAAVF